MIRLRGGPAAGSYAVKRAPLYLRAVVAPDGTKDVLDQPTDTPRDGETVSVYRRVGDAGVVHLCMANRRASGFYAMAEYEHMPDVNGEDLRDNDVWRAWARERSDAG